MLKTLIYRVLKLLSNLGAISGIWKINYQGKIFSLNDWYHQGHWSKRHKLKNEYGGKFHDMFVEAELGYCNEFYLIIFFNTRHDTDNLAGIAKVLVDTMKGRWIPEDNKKHYKGLLIFPDESLEKNSLEILIVKQK